MILRSDPEGQEVNCRRADEVFTEDGHAPTPGEDRIGLDLKAKLGVEHAHSTIRSRTSMISQQTEFSPPTTVL